MREVIDQMARKNLNSKQNLGKDKRMEYLEKTFDPSGMHNINSKPYYEKLVNYYDELSEIAHHNKEVDENRCKEILEDIVSILLELTKPPTIILDEIDQISSQKPSKDNAKELQKYTLFYQLRLVDNLSSEWLPFLHDVGYFKCKKFGKQYKKDSPNFRWPPSEFLTKCVDNEPDMVRDIILECNFSENESRTWIPFIDFIECAIKLPISHAKKISEKILSEKWHISVSKWGLNKYADLVERMYLKGEYVTALDMLKNLLSSDIKDSKSLTIDNIKPMIDEYAFENILNKKIPTLFKNNPVPILELLSTLLENYVDRFVDEGNRHNDGSISWRITIEAHSRNFGYHACDFLVNHLRDCLVSMGQDNPDELKRNLKKIREKRHSIFKRLEIFIYEKFWSEFLDEIEETLLKNFNDYLVYHEYYNLIKKTFGFVSQDTRDGIIRNIDETYKIKSKDQENNARLWKHRMFEPIQQHLDPSHEKEYNEFVEKNGPEPHPGFPFPDPVTTPYRESTDEFNGKTLEQVFDIIMKHRIVQDVFTPEDKIANKFNSYVVNNFEDCSKHALELKKADPIFSYILFNCLNTPKLVGKEIDWDNVLNLVEYVIPLIMAKQYPANVIYGDPPVLICSMISRGLEDKTIPIQMQEKVLDIILKLVEIGDKSPDLQYELDGHSDSFTLAINNIVGKSFQVLCQYAMWYKQITELKEFLLKTKEIFDEYVKDKKKHTASRHAILGTYLFNFYNLDEDWTRDMLGKIGTSLELKIAFWEAYIHNNILENVFKDLYSWYNEFLNGSIRKVSSRKSIRLLTIRHVMLAYIHDLTDADKIFLKFIKNICNDDAQYCIRQLESVIYDYEDNRSVNRERVKDLLENDKLFKNAEMYGWLTNKIFDKKYNLEKFLNYLENVEVSKIDLFRIRLKDLDPYIKEYPKGVTDCLDTILDKLPNNKHYIPHHELKPLLKKLKKIKNKDIEKRVYNIINKLIKLGYPEYKDLA